MHQFVVVVGESGAAVPPSIDPFLRAHDHPYLPFDPGACRRWGSPDRSIAFAGWEAPGPEPHGRVDEQGAIAYNGFPRPRTGRWDRCRSILDHVHASIDSLDEVTGQFTLASLTTEGGLLRADRFGMAALFIARTERLTVIGNRSALVAHAFAAATGQPVRRDVRGAAFVAWSGFKLGSSTGYQGVEFVPRDHRVHIDPRGVRVEPPAEHLLAAGGVEATLDETLEELIAGLYHAIDRSNGPPVLELTGGKDSRLALAVAMIAGLHDRVLTLTRGEPSIPDQKTACQIVETLSLDSTDPPMLPRTLGFVEQHRAHTQRCDALISGFDWSHPSADRRLTISSHAGEMMRSGLPAPTDPADLAEACHQFSWAPFGKVPVVEAGLAAEFSRETEALLVAGTAVTDDPSELRELFNFEHKGRWLSTRPDSGPPRMLGMLTQTGARYAWARDRAFRASEPVHYPLIEQASSALLAAPLVKDGWNREIASPPAFEPGPVRNGPAMAHQRQWSLRAEERGSAIRSVLLEDPASPAYEFLDRELAVDLCSRFATLRQDERRQLLGAVTAVLWANESEGGARSEWPLHRGEINEQPAARRRRRSALGFRRRRGRR